MTSSLADESNPSLSKWSTLSKNVIPSLGKQSSQKLLQHTWHGWSKPPTLALFLPQPPEHVWCKQFLKSFVLVNATHFKWTEHGHLPQQTRLPPSQQIWSGAYVTYKRTKASKEFKRRVCDVESCCGQKDSFMTIKPLKNTDKPQYNTQERKRTWE